MDKILMLSVALLLLGSGVDIRPLFSRFWRWLTHTESTDIYSYLAGCYVVVVVAIIVFQWGY